MPRRFRHPCKQIGGVDDSAGLAAPAANLLPPLENLSGSPARVFLIFHMGRGVSPRKIAVKRN